MSIKFFRENTGPVSVEGPRTKSDWNKPKDPMERCIERSTLSPITSPLFFYTKAKLCVATFAPMEY